MRVCLICEKDLGKVHALKRYCDDCKKIALINNVKKYSKLKNRKCLDCYILISYQALRCKSCNTAYRNKREERFGFVKGHKDFRTKEGLKRMGEKLSRQRKGVTIDASHLAKYQYKQDSISWNKGMKGKYGGWKRYLSDETREKISLALRGKPRFDKRGEKSHFWKGGKTELRKSIEHIYKYREWRRKVFERDNYTCRRCDQRGGYLEAHHKKEMFKILLENSIITIEQALNCEELWDIDNGETLCLKCHERNGRPNHFIKQRKSK